MRITGGRLRGRRILAPRGRDIRPTSDRVREAVFNLLGQDLEGNRVLDLFAGTGALGIESLSRGAVFAAFVDRSPAALRLIVRNLEQCGLAQDAQVIRHDLRRGPPPAGPEGREAYDVIFLDPPYGRELIAPILRALPGWTGLGPKGLVVAETASQDDPLKEAGGLELVKKRRYGDTAIHIFAWNRRKSTEGETDR